MIMMTFIVSRAFIPKYTVSNVVHYANNLKAKTIFHDFMYHAQFNSVRLEHSLSYGSLLSSYIHRIYNFLKIIDENLEKHYVEIFSNMVNV